MVRRPPESTLFPTRRSSDLLPDVISEATKVPVFIAQDPLDCVAVGTGESLKNIEVMRRSRR